MKTGVIDGSVHAPDIGFIGLGIMGEPMAGHLAAAGYRISVHDIDRSRCESVARNKPRIQVCDSPQEVAASAEIVICMLPSGKYVREVALGERGLIHGFRPGSILLDTSSCEPWLTVETARVLAEKNVSMVDAPVSGAQVGAIRAELVFMMGGDAESIRRVTPLLDAMGKQAFHLGPVGAGHAMKCINNLVTATTLLATAEGLTIGKRFGLDPVVMTDVMNASTAQSWISRTHIKQRVLSRSFDDPFKLGLMVKDVQIAVRLANEMQLPLRLSSLNQQLWDEAGMHEGGDASVSRLVGWLEHVTHVEITSGCSTREGTQPLANA